MSLSSKRLAFGCLAEANQARDMIVQPSPVCSIHAYSGSLLLSVQHTVTSQELEANNLGMTVFVTFKRMTSYEKVSDTQTSYGCCANGFCIRYSGSYVIIICLSTYIGGKRKILFGYVLVTLSTQRMCITTEANKALARPFMSSSKYVLMKGPLLYQAAPISSITTYTYLLPLQNSTHRPRKPIHRPHTEGPTQHRKPLPTGPTPSHHSPAHLPSGMCNQKHHHHPACAQIYIFPPQRCIHFHSSLYETNLTKGAWTGRSAGANFPDANVGTSCGKRVHADCPTASGLERQTQRMEGLCADCEE